MADDVFWLGILMLFWSNFILMCLYEIEMSRGNRTNYYMVFFNFTQLYLDLLHPGIAHNLFCGVKCFQNGLQDNVS